MSLLEQHPWLVAPLVPLALFIVHAMVECTMSLLARPARPRAAPLGLDQVRSRLLELGGPYRIVEHERGQFRPRWEVIDPAWAVRPGVVKLSTVYRATLLLDGERTQGRWYESVRSGSLFIGFAGARPLFNLPWSYAGGLLDVRWRGEAYSISPGFPPMIAEVRAFDIDTGAAKQAIQGVLHEAGWAFRPVGLPFGVNATWRTLTRRLTPAALLRLPDRSLWATLYPVSFAAFLLYVYVLVGEAGFGRADYLLALTITAGWWGVWAVVTWLLGGFRRRGAPEHGPRSRTPSGRQRRRHSRSVTPS